MPGALQLSDARQPRYAAGSLSQGLVCAIHWGWQHRAVFNSARRSRGGGITPEIIGGNSGIRHWGGLSGIGWSATGTAQFITACNQEEIGTAGTTIYCLQRHTDTTNRISSLFGVSDGGTLTRRCGSHCPSSDGSVYWDYGGATNGTTRVIWALGGKNVNRLNRWCFVAAPRGLELWFQGVLRGSTTTAASRTTADDDRFMIGAGNVTALVNSDLSEVYLFLVWNRGLSQGEVRRLDANPWQVFATSDIQRSFVPSAASSPQVLSMLHWGGRRVG